MINLLKLQTYLNAVFRYPDKPIIEIDPYMTNGLMVKGKEEIKRIGFGVSASLALFKKAKEADCDVIIVHHAFNLPPTPNYDFIFQNRIGYLIINDISLFGFHFLLDWHPEIGNNVQLLMKMGAVPEEPYMHKGNPWGWIGKMDGNATFTRCVSTLKKYISPKSVIYNFGPENIRRIVAISGNGAPNAFDMKNLIDKKIDLYVTGEAHEWNQELFREAKINFIAGGHYHTEVFGITALKEKIKSEFSSVETVWLDLPNDV
jgi:dinuclear metal center YbgI/SA1388 family protein